MIHSSHHIKVYRHWRHLLLTIFIVCLPAIFLLALGGLAQVEVASLLAAVGLSLYRLAAGYLISLVLGVALAVAFSGNRFASAVVPLFDVLQNIPSFALIPLFILAFGYTNFMAVAFAATSIIWPILFYVLGAIRNARTELNDAATIFGARGWRRVLYYTLPLAFPAIITGSIVGISIGWEAVIGIEIIGLHNGIGVFLTQASNSGNQTLLLGGIAFILVLVFVVNKVIWLPLLKQSLNHGE